MVGREAQWTQLRSRVQSQCIVGVIMINNNICMRYIRNHYMLHHVIVLHYIFPLLQCQSIGRPYHSPSS